MSLNKKKNIPKTHNLYKSYNKQRLYIKMQSVYQERHHHVYYIDHHFHILNPFRQNSVELSNMQHFIYLVFYFS